mmetsp:Transcript_33930/g.35232  ORF Transcript_33930/g.35232 Transcript_33930/m.35232 type:complete len:92 (+) Transcript_33930:14-289(+)
MKNIVLSLVLLISLILSVQSSSFLKKKTDKSDSINYTSNQSTFQLTTDSKLLDGMNGSVTAKVNMDMKEVPKNGGHFNSKQNYLVIEDSSE